MAERHRPLPPAEMLKHYFLVHYDAFHVALVRKPSHAQSLGRALNSFHRSNHHGGSISERGRGRDAIMLSSFLAIAPVAQEAAKNLNLNLRPIGMGAPAELERILEGAKKEGIDSLYVISSRHTVAYASRIIEFANKQRLPLVAGWGGWVQAGGLISYGPNIEEMVRRATGHLDIVLKGGNPGDIPIQQPTRFELLINLRTARVLGLDIPETFLLRALK